MTIKLPERKLPNWLKSYGEYTQNTEAPPHFWLWSGIFTVASALERKVWLPFGYSKLYPNLYIFIVAPPGKCRKGGPVSMSKRFLEKAECNVAADSTTKPSLCREMATLSRYEQLPDGTVLNHSPLAIISRELSSLLQTDLKQMIEVITDLYDAQDMDFWEYKTKGAGTDRIPGPCLSMLAATTPNWLANNLPPESIGAGFTSRIVMVTHTQSTARVTFPSFDENLWELLRKDLSTIHLIKGEFRWDPEAQKVFDEWYQNRIDKEYYKVLNDPRFISFVDRIHTICMKISMALHVARSNELILEVEDILQAISLLEDLLPHLKDAFGGVGKNRYGPEIYQIMQLVQKRRRVTFSELLGIFWTNLNEWDLKIAVRTVEAQGLIKVVSAQQKDGTMDQILTWIGD